jgi:phage-related minor tail protein
MGGGLLGNFFGFFGKAGGGPVMAGKPYMVGESGRELFVPNSAGSIVPSHQLNGDAQTRVTYNIQAVDAASFRSMVARDPSFIYAVTEQGRRSQPTRSR